MSVRTWDAFHQYQREEAWTWEHQALVRARVVFGEQALAKRFNDIRREVLTRTREPQPLQTEVRATRVKMRQHPGNKHQGRWDINAVSGGLTELQFVY